MTWYHTDLTGIRSHLTDDTVGIASGDIQELITACCLIMGTGGIHHVPEVIEFVTQEVLYLPAFLTCPLVGMLWVNGTGSIEIAIRLLCSPHHIQHTVDIDFQLVVRIGL